MLYVYDVNISTQLVLIVSVPLLEKQTHLLD